MHLHMAKIKHVKYFIGYETDNKIILLFNNVPQVTGWKKIHQMNLLIKDKELLEKYKPIWYQIENIKKAFDTQPNYKEKFVNTK